ncbi:MAG TPA: hypothetical protein VIP09_12165 [Dehalococcoidia bacterium]
MPLTITNKLSTPAAALTKYGYVLDAATGLWRKSRGEHGFDLSTEQWLPVDGGFLCFIAPRSGFGSIPFGWPVAALLIGTVAQIITGVSDGAVVRADAPTPVVGLVQVPQGLADEWTGTSGLHPASHPQAYRWVWTADEVAFTYQFAEEGWTKTQDPATGAVTMRREHD